MTFEEWWEKNEEKVEHDIGRYPVDEITNLTYDYCKKAWDTSRKVVFSELIREIRKQDNREKK